MPVVGDWSSCNFVLLMWTLHWHHANNKNPRLHDRPPWCIHGLEEPNAMRLVYPTDSPAKEAVDELTSIQASDLAGNAWCTPQARCNSGDVAAGSRAIA